MDALPVEDCIGFTFVSDHLGLMHACGHDIHTSVGFGVAQVFEPLAPQLVGMVSFQFQPAEETLQ